jgi:hypothetical protein
VDDVVDSHPPKGRVWTRVVSHFSDRISVEPWDTVHQVTKGSASYTDMPELVSDPETDGEESRGQSLCTYNYNINRTGWITDDGEDWVVMTIP